MHGPLNVKFIEALIADCEANTASCVFCYCGQVPVILKLGQMIQLFCGCSQRQYILSMTSTFRNRSLSFHHKNKSCLTKLPGELEANNFQLIKIQLTFTYIRMIETLKTVYRLE